MIHRIVPLPFLPAEHDYYRVDLFGNLSLIRHDDLLTNILFAAFVLTFLIIIMLRAFAESPPFHGNKVAADQIHLNDIGRKYRSLLKFKTRQAHRAVYERQSWQLVVFILVFLISLYGTGAFVMGHATPVEYKQEASGTSILNVSGFNESLAKDAIVASQYSGNETAFMFCKNDQTEIIQGARNHVSSEMLTDLYRDSQCRGPTGIFHIHPDEERLVYLSGGDLRALNEPLIDVICAANWRGSIECAFLEDGHRRFARFWISFSS